MKRVHVAAAVIRNAAGEILIARRPEDKHQGGLWEFPGGKVEAGEPVLQALARELDEELGIRPTQARPLIRISHDYPDKQVLLDVWLVSAFSGEAYGREQQPLRWVSPCDLSGYDFPAANRPIVTAACLPERYLITPELAEIADILAWLAARLDQGIRLVQWRAKQGSRERYIAVGRELAALCRDHGASLMLNGPAELLEHIPAQGLQLSAAALQSLETRPIPATYLLGASVHDALELSRAQALGVDFVCLSPLAATASHPGATPLGWPAFSKLCAQAVVPVYALGGMQDQDIEQAWQAGAQGVAGIRGIGLKSRS